MTDTRNDTLSVVERTQAIDGGRRGGRRAFSRPHRGIRARRRGGGAGRAGWRAAAHCSARRRDPGHGCRHYTRRRGGDDGQGGRDRPKGRASTLATDPKRRWIDHVALGPDGALAWSAGKTAFVQAKELRQFEAPSTVGGLAFLPKGFRLAIAHYNGATLWFPNAAAAEPEKFEWKGSHLGVSVSPDGALPGDHDAGANAARLADRRPATYAHVRLCGPRHLGRLDGRRPAGWRPPGATQIILWPFQTKDGPMGKQPRLLAPSAHRVDGRRLPSAAGHRRRRL